LNCATSLTPSSAESLPYSKPHPQVYLNCAASLGVDPMACVALEDSVNGMIASKAARMRSIVVPAEENSRDPRFVLADVKLTTLESLTASGLAAPFPASDRRGAVAIIKNKTSFHFYCFSVLHPLCLKKRRGYAHKSAYRGAYGTERLRPDG
jgi:sugar-phosphatase